MNNQLTAPIRFSPSLERPDVNEAETTQGLIATMRYITEKTLADGGHAIRGVHAKSHGILQGHLEVDADLPGDLAQGMFAKPGRFPVVMRLSTISGDILDDSVSTPRGMAVKIIGVEGERLEGSERDVTQDFVMINGPAFGAPTPKKFLSVLRLLAKTTDQVEWLKKILSAVMRQVQRVIVAVTGHPNVIVATLGGQPETHILGETFYSQAPLRFGDFYRKNCGSTHIFRIDSSHSRAAERKRCSQRAPRSSCRFFQESGGTNRRRRLGCKWCSRIRRRIFLELTTIPR